jgi:hypothetical protein
MPPSFDALTHVVTGLQQVRQMMKEQRRLERELREARRTLQQQQSRPATSESDSDGSDVEGGDPPARP